MRYWIYAASMATGLYAMTAMAGPVSVVPPIASPAIILAQATTTPAPVGQAQMPTPAPGQTQTRTPPPAHTPGQPMEHGPGMGPMMGGQGGHPGPMGGMAPCAAGKTMSGTPPVCK